MEDTCLKTMGLGLVTVPNCIMTHSISKRPKLQQGEGKQQNQILFQELVKHKFVEQETEAYKKKLQESGGFEVGPVPDEILWKRIVSPIWAENSPNSDMAKFALTHHNLQNDTSYQFVKLVRINGQVLGKYRDYYFTFQAEDEMTGSPPPNFQAIVLSFMKEYMVLFCMLE